jgi:photosystem II stability/assembly factor-like uncharacterized protein
MTVAVQFIKRGLYVVLITAGLANWLVLLSPVMGVTYVNAAPITAKPVLNDSLSQSDQVASDKASQALSRLPLSFAACPTSSPSRFSARTSGGNIYLSATEAMFEMPSRACVTRLDCGADLGVPRNAGSQLAVHKLPGPRRDPAASRTTPSAALQTLSPAVRLQLIGGNSRAPVRGADELAGKNNYIIGNDPSQWRTNISTYARVRVENVYRGIDMVYYGHPRALEHDFKVAPGASYKAIRLRFKGAQSIRVDAAGDLLIATAAGVICQQRPVAYQAVKGARREVKAAYVVSRKREVSFRLGAYDHNQPLVIDPVLSYSTYLGGNGNDEGRGIAVDAAGNAYITGRAQSTDFPTTAGAFQKSKAVGSIFNAFVCKLNAAGTDVVYATYLGGNILHRALSDQPIRVNDEGTLPRFGETAFAIAVDAAGNAYITGETDSGNFPTTPGALRSTPLTDPAIAINSDAFVTKLNPTGSALVYSTYLGGLHALTEVPVTGRDLGLGIAVDATGNAYVTGYTNSGDFPTANALQPALNTAKPFTSDAFLTKLNPTGSALVYSTYLGGDDEDYASGIALDGGGNAYITGRTRSANFPVTPGAVQPGFAGETDAFIAKVDAMSAALVYSTYLGGSSTDTASGIGVDATGNAYVTGTTFSTDFPTANPLQPVNASGPAFKSTDGGDRWTVINTGLMATPVRLLVVDPKTPATVYAGTSRKGIFKTTDGGSRWNAINTGLANQEVGALALDPVTPTTLYAGLSSGGVFKSTDGGSHWDQTGLTTNTSITARITALVVDPTNSLTLYAAGDASRFPPEAPISARETAPLIPPLPLTAVYKSTDGGLIWHSRGVGIAEGVAVSALAINPQTPTTLYASAGDVYKSVDAADSWSPTGDKVGEVQALAIDSKDPSIIYAGGLRGVQRSQNGGNRWREINTGLPDSSITTLVINPVTTATIYAATDVGVSRSTNGGDHWKDAGLRGSDVLALAIDPTNPSTLYAGTGSGGDAFIAKLSTTGAALVYSTYFGGHSSETSNAIAVDAAGNVTITGETASDDYLIKNAIQSQLNQESDAFIARFNAAGNALIYSTYFGGNSISTEGGSAVALDAVGNAYVTGFTSSRDLRTVNAIQAKLNGSLLDGFVLKLALPRVIAVTVEGKKLVVSGEGFDSGAVILINNTAQKPQNSEASPTTVLISKKGANKIPVGQSVMIQVRNPDGTLSNAVPFVRPNG